MSNVVAGGKDRPINCCCSYARQSVDRLRKPRSGDRSYENMCDSYSLADANPLCGGLNSVLTCGKSAISEEFFLALPIGGAMVTARSNAWCGADGGCAVRSRGVFISLCVGIEPLRLRCAAFESRVGDGVLT